MAKDKHKIKKSAAIALQNDFDAKRKTAEGLFRNLPDGFLFDAAGVRTLLSHPDAKKFFIRFGWKNNGRRGTLAPVLCVLDANNNVIEGKDPAEELITASGKISMETPMAMSFGAPLGADDEKEGGGYLDEGFPHPPIVEEP